MIYVMLIGAICVAEFVIRRHINKKFTASERKSIGKGHITLRKYHNAGMANDTLEKRPALVKGIGVGVVSLITVTFVLVMMLKGKKALKAGLALILGGGLANLLERFLHGYVTDYIQFQIPIPFLRKFIYNIADLCIFIGTAVLFFRELLRMD